ncbi:MAG: type III-A CRISPR-associated RAMP protein Csm4, partial [Promethearchaeota archaeon]
KLLTDNGIGGERSLGAGLFDDVVIEPLEKEPNLNDLFSNGEESNHREFMNLSLVYPATPKIDMKHVKFYSLLDRTGYCYSLDSKTQRFLDVKFIKEGSVFTGKIKGKLVQVASKEFARTHHEVYKNGIGFYMNIGPNQAEEGEI